MALLDRPPVIISLRVISAVLMIAAVLLVSTIGGVLNRAHGGYLDVNKIVPGNESNLGVYWGRYIVSKAVFALPTGLLVALTGLHLRAGGLIAMLTLCTLFISWGNYMNIGFELCNFKSREGIYDWLLGRQELHWKLTQRFLREYSGMSLIGLVWTAPQGYALLQMGFGWQYSLVGCLMGFVYYLGGATARSISIQNNSFFQDNAGMSEFYWGTLIWLVLLVSSLSQLVYRVRKWVYARSTGVVPNPHMGLQLLKYASLNRLIMRLWYEATMAIILILFACTVMFYSLIIQKDTLNKGQTMFGLFTSVMALIFFMGWVWGQAYLKWQIKKVKNAQSNFPSHEQSIIRQSQSPPRISDSDRLHLEGGLPPYTGKETDRLLPWPYSHPDKGLADPRLSPLFLNGSPRSSTPPVAYGSTPSIQNTLRNRNQRSTTPQLSPAELAFVLLWSSIEKYICLDIFILLRHLIGFLTLLCMLSVFFMTTVSTVIDINSPRFNPQYTIVDNSSIWPKCQ